MDLPNNAPLAPEPKKNWFLNNKILSSVIGILLLVVIAGAAYWLKETQPNQIQNEEEQLVVPDGWKKYQSNILGIEFSYPDSWGEPNTSPAKYITNLETLVDRFKDQDNLYYHSLYIEFPNKPELKFRIFDNMYPGERYPNSRAYSYGYMDNIPTVVASGNICDYKIHFEMPNFPEKIKELNTQCQNKIKRSFAETEQDFEGTTGILYTYVQKDHAFFKLGNKIFPYSLITLRYPHTKQLKEKISYDQYINENAGKVDDSDFKIFVSSLKSFEPTVASTPSFTADPKDSADVTLIKRYYYFLSTGHYENAFELRTGINNFESYKESVSVIQTASPKTIRLLATGQYEVLLDYQIHNSEPQQQRAIYEIINGKLKEIFIETIRGQIVSFGNRQAYASSRGDKNVVIMRQNDKETLIDEAPNDFEKTLDTLIFHNVLFSPKGNFITYRAGGWEWAFFRVYDISKNKIVYETSPGLLNTFNKEETLFFTCVYSEMGGEREFALYEVPSFKVKINLLKQYPEIKEYWNYQCSYDKVSNVVIVYFSGKIGDENAKQEFKFDSLTGKLIN
jgi:hypothetical protein